MTIQTSEAREMCSKSEWELIASSFSPMVEMFPRSALKSRLDRARKLHQKLSDLISLQHSESRKRTTHRKTEMFAEAIERFEAALNSIESTASANLAPKDVHNKSLAEATRTLNMDALRQRVDRDIESRKSEVLSAMAVHGAQQAQKSGAKHIQSHVGSANRRQQGRRDMKNR